MDLTEKLSLWGAMHVAARDAARMAEGQNGPDPARRREAERLREDADRLHREIYRELGSGDRHGRQIR